MGYPVAYRTGAAREERRLSRPVEPVPQDNKPFPRKPANDNYPQRRGPLPEIPPRGFPKLTASQVVSIVGAVAKVHPALRVLSTAYDLYNLWRENGWMLSNFWGGAFNLQCSVSPADLCNPPDCVTYYCGGPVFLRSLQPFSLCGLGGQAYTGDGSSAFPGYIPGGRFTQDILGVITYMLRPANCGQPAAVLQQWRTKVGYREDQVAGRVLEPPVVRHYYPVSPVVRPWSPYRWLAPEVTMKPQEVFTPDPEPIPYEMIPNRPMSEGNTERGYDVESAPVAEPYAFRQPARPGTKEKKVKWSGAVNIMNAVLVTLARADGKLKDLRDILGAMNDALPKELQAKGKDKKTLQGLLRNVWRNLDKMDGEKALAGIIKEIAEDVVGGFGDQLKTEAAKNFGWTKQKLFTSPRF